MDQVYIAISTRGARSDMKFSLEKIFFVELFKKYPIFAP